jgi:hypothetical protein
MATKQDKAVQKAVTKAEQRAKVREEKHLLWFLLALILLLLWLLFAQHNGWWPYSRPTLGSAFYTNIGSGKPIPENKDSSNTSGSENGSNNNGGNSGSSGTNGTNGTNGSNGSNGSNGGGGTTTPPTSSSSLLDFATKVNVGDSKTEVSGQANNLGENCAVIVNAQTQTSLGKQEVCTYTEGDKIVTVTYFNDQVVSASKSGF